MIGSSTICGIAIGLIATALLGLIFWVMYSYNLSIKHWIPLLYYKHLFLNLPLLQSLLNSFYIYNIPETGFVQTK